MSDLTANMGTGSGLTATVGLTASWGGDVLTDGALENWTVDNIVTNGGFDTDTDWTKEAGWAINGGVAIGTATTGYLYQSALTVGVTYSITFTISSYAGGGVRVRCGTTSGTTRSADGTYVQSLLCASNTYLYIDGVTAFTGNIDNVIVTPA